MTNQELKVENIKMRLICYTKKNCTVMVSELEETQQ